MNYLSIDTESGGRDEQYSLLTAAFIIFDENFNELDSLYLTLRPDDGIYRIGGQGMSVNKIDIVEHDKIAIPYKDAKTPLYNFLKKNANGELLTPIGHAVKGDIRRCQQNLISEGSWNQFCTYHFIDTSVVLQFLRACGKMPSDCDGSIEALCEYFSIEGNDDRYHDAYVDAKATAKVLQKMIDIGKK